MPPTIRSAEPADYDRIAPLLDEWWGRTMHTLLPRLFLDHFHTTSFVADSGPAPAGVLVGFLSPADPGAAYIHAVAVAPEHRGHGLARRLYTRFLDLAEAAGRRRVQAVTSPQNQASIAFHRAVGFTASAPVPDHAGPGRPRVVFERSLA